MSKMTRRQLLGASGIGAAALAVGPFAAARSARAAQMLPAFGQVVIVKRGGLALHTYVAPDPSLSVTTHIVETPNALVVVDSQFLQTFAGDAAAYVESLGKPVELHILSHAHPDHFLGANQFGETPFVATAATAAAVQGYFDSEARATLGGQVGEAEVPTAEAARVPEGTIEVGEQVIDGVTFTFEIVENAESAEELIIGVPDAGALIVQDLIYNNNHFFPGVDRELWIAALEDLTTREGFDTLLVGHGLPTSRGELDEALSYLRFVQEIKPTVADGPALIAALEAEYPSYTGNGILPFWNQLF